MINWLRLGLAVALCGSAGWAVDWKQLRPQGCVSDFAGVVAPGATGQLEAYCGAVERSTGAKIALVTISSLEGEPVADVARDLFRAWNLGSKPESGGILLLLAVRDRHSQLVAGATLSRILPADLESRVLREMSPAIREDDYGDALAAAAQTIGGAIARARKTAIPATLTRRHRPPFIDRIPWPVFVGVVLFAAWLLYSRRLRGFGGAGVSGILRRATWGSRGSGGFGAFDSADRFGGFGGADSGGGGASSDW